MSTATLPAPALERVARPRHYVMCPPTHFDVRYAINPWMRPGGPVDLDLALRQWGELVAVYERLGHRVDVLTPAADLPDMVFAANGALVLDGRAFGASFAHPERQREAELHRVFLQRAGYADVHIPRHVNEGEGDFLVVGDLVLAGTGFRTDVAAHREAQEFFGRPVITLELADPRFYHLDTAVAVLDDHTIAWYPGAFSPGSQGVVRTLFPDSVEASEADAAVLGLNAVSDGRHVVLPSAAGALSAQLAERGWLPIGVDLSELLKAGGSVKCCTLELRDARRS
ncbi:N-Dimethylarginine dimethylaminohydrolase [Modestobacter sp. DSM 44400]|uniref:dimethylargininase n=1 Tax=Modestobacter sp. DSM 44400 TaxID=1550230 RepID=UPI00089B869C|nr:dimethylargininase [Modestobacter sp. DSM 44400]SDX94713.1 N-Dimethylarginine dimethylaminohydrolase [Modestobacter sp. DSM 44400]